MNKTNETAWLTPAWMQKYLEALREMLSPNDELKAEMIDFLFDVGLWDRSKLSFAGAVARFNGCLNPSTTTAFFKPVEIVLLMKRFDRHHFFLAMAEDLGYRVERIPTEERRNRQLERLAAAVEQHNAIQQRIADELAEARAELGQIDAAGPKKRIHPGLREGGAFDLDAEPKGAPIDALRPLTDGF